MVLSRDDGATIRPDAPDRDFGRMMRSDVLKLFMVGAVLFVVLTVAFSGVRTVRAHPTRRPVAASGSSDVIATLGEWHVTLGRTTLAPDRYTFHIVNAGAVQHELIAFKMPLAANVLPVNSHGDVNEEAPGLVKATDGENLGPSTSQVRTIDLTSPGTYAFLCNLPGHYALGMRAVVTVTSRSSG